MILSKQCQQCRQEFKRDPHLGFAHWNTQRFCSRRCAGRSLPTKAEYKRTSWGDLKRPLHRVLMEGFLGRKLTKDELVHHKNGDKHDNRIENLEVMTAPDHGRLHNLKYPLTKQCVVCGSTFTPHKTKRKRQKTCSPTCKIALLTRLNKSRSKRPSLL